MLEKYRPTMNEDVLHSWAKDAQNKLNKTNKVLKELYETLKPKYELSEEGKSYLNKINKLLQE